MLRGDENAVPHNTKKSAASNVVTKLCANFEAKAPRTQDSNQVKKAESRTPKAQSGEKKNLKIEADRASATSEGLSLTPSTPCSPSRQPFKRILSEETLPSATKDAKVPQSMKKARKSVEKRDSSPLRTCIRFKPQGPGEHLDLTDRSASIQDNTVVLKDKKDNIRYSFDEVFAENVTQEDMFERAARKQTDDFLDGYNATIFAYGQTGSGKTHTMLGDLDLRSTARGITPRVFVHVFDELAARQSEFEVKVSFMQIYNEKCQDLLNPFVNTKIGHVEEDLKVRESADRVYVEGLSQVVCKTAEQAVEWVAKGIRNRKTGKTAMNTESSRSHSILTLELTTKKYVSRLNLIDLAGSENQKTSTASSATQQNEANNINLSLTWLGQCLRDTVKGGAVVNYRNSKLTKILKDSLGGTAKTCVIATVSALPAFAFETASTLKFASTIKLIQTHAVRNVAKGAGDASSEAENARLRSQMEELQAQLAAQARQYEAKLKAAMTTSQSSTGFQPSALSQPSTLSSLFEEAAKSLTPTATASAVSPSSTCSHCRDLQIEVAGLLQGKREAEELVARLQANEAPEMKEMRGAYDSLLAQMSKGEKGDHIAQALQKAQAVIGVLQKENDDLRQDLRYMVEQRSVEGREASRQGAATIRRVAERGAAASSEEAVNALQAEVLRMQETSREDLTKIDEYRTLLQDLESKKAADAQKIEELQAEVRQLRKGAAPPQDASNGAANIEELRAQVHQLQASLGEYEQRTKELNEQLDSRSTEMTQLKERCRQYNHKVTKMRCEKQHTANIEIELKSNLNKVQTENQDLQRRMSEMQQQMTTDQEKNNNTMKGHSKAVLEKLEGDFGNKLPLQNKPRFKYLDGMLKRVSSQGKLLEYHFFLLSDILIYASPSKHPNQCKYKAHRVLHLGLCRLVDIQPRPDSEADTLYSNSFRLITPQKSEEKDNPGFYISCDTPQEKQTWMTEIRTLIEKIYSQPEGTCPWVQVPRAADVSAPERTPDTLPNPFVDGGFNTARSSFSMNEEDCKDLMRSREPSLDFADQNLGDFPTEIGTVGLTWDHDDPNRPRAPSNESVMSRSRAGSISSTMSRMTEFSEFDLPTSNTDFLRAKVQANDYCRLCVRQFTSLQLSSRQKTKCGCCGDETVCRGCCSNKAVPPRSSDGKEVKVCLACYGGIKGLIGRGLPRLSVEYD